MKQKIRLRLLTDFKLNFWKTRTLGENFWRVQSFFLLSQQNEFVFVNQIWYCKALTQYSIAQKIGFRLLRDFRLKKIYSKLQYREKVFREFETLPHFSEKMVLYLLTKFGILKPETNIAWSRRFDLGLWQTSEEFSRKLQYKEKAFEESQGLPPFPRK